MDNFYKTFKIICEKKSKNESIAKELEWIQSQLMSENPKFCENSVNILTLTSESGFVLNQLLSALSRVPRTSYEIVADGIFKILTEDLKSPSYKSQFGILVRPHPVLLMVDESCGKMLYLTRKIVDILNNDNINFRNNCIEFLRPILLTILCNDKIYSESREICRNLVSRSDMVSEILALRRTSEAPACLLNNSMILMELPESTAKSSSLLMLIASTKRLAEFSLDPTENFKTISKHLEVIDTSTANIVLFLLAEILQTISIFHVAKLLQILEKLIVRNNFGHPVILGMVLEGLIQILAYPLFAKGQLSTVEKIILHIQNKEGIPSNKTSENLFTNPDLTNARDLSIMLENQQNLNITRISTEADRFFWTRNQLVLRGIFHNDNSCDTEVIANLIEISKISSTSSSSLFLSMLYKLANSSSAKMKLVILQSMVQLGATSEIFSTIKALSAGMLRSMSIDLHLRLWKVEPRTYPFLHKALVEKSPTDKEDKALEIAKASAIQEICNLRPQHGSDLVSIISEFLNNPDSGDIPACLAIESIILLCQNHIINIISTWKAISVVTRYEKRPRVVTSLCKFYASVPSFKRSNLEYENFSKEILNRLWQMIQWGDQHQVKHALEAMKSWNYDLMTLDMIPENFREGIALPEAPEGMEVSILDLEVPGECFVQLMMKVPQAGELLIHYLGCEINEFRSGHYLVKEGQPEPINFKNLPKQSILKALVSFVIQQTMTSKAEKLVGEDILVEALRILGAKYSRHLPPLNWCFLSDLMTKSERLRYQSLKLAAKQSVISGTARRITESFVTKLDGDNDIEVKIAFDFLADICDGVSSEILKTFCEFIFKVDRQWMETKMMDILRLEKNIAKRENLVIILSCYLKFNANLSKDFVQLIPPKILDAIFSQLSTEQKICYRCEILEINSSVENPVAWLNELLYLDSPIFLTSFISLLTTTDTFPKKKFLADFIIMTQNRMVEDDFPNEKLKYSLEIFIISVVVISGNIKILRENEKSQENLVRIFPQSIELVSLQPSYDDLIGRIFDFLHQVIDHDRVCDEIKSLCKQAIVLSKEHVYFQKTKVWQKCLMMR